jgi:hypothetical protein
MIELVKEQESSIATLLKIELGGSLASPEDLSGLEFPELEGSKGLVISGFPMYVALAVAAHYKNLVSWIAVVDLKVNPESVSAVVVWSVKGGYLRGDVVPLSSCGLSFPVPTAAR